MIKHPKFGKAPTQTQEVVAPVRSESTPAAEVAATDGEPEKKFLTSEQVALIENSRLRSKIIAMEKKILDLQSQLEDRDLKLLQYDFKERSLAHKERVQALSKKAEQLKSDEEGQKEKNKVLIQNIAVEHGLGEGSFSYNPETYEVIVD